MKIQNNSPLNFQKNLAATCSVIKNNKPYPCKIYEINPYDDKDYFLDGYNSKNWENSEFWLVLSCSFHKDFKDRVYVMEHGKKCLGLMALDCSKANKGANINFLETIPENRGESENKPAKYIGETLIAFLAKMSQSAHSPQITVDNWLLDAENFYKRCKFNLKVNSENREDELVLDSTAYEYLIKQNENHTGRKIKMLG